MATRFYFPNTGAADITPAFGSWGNSAGADRIHAVRTRISSAMTDRSVAHSGTAANEYVLLRQYVSSESLGAQTLTGTIKGQIRCWETHGGASCDLAVRIAVCDSTGGNIREILAITSEGGVAGNEAGAAPEFIVPAGTERENRRFEEGTDDFDLALTSTGIDANDRLIIEVGYGKPSSTTSGARIGGAVFGDDSATDLAEDETTQTADNPWIEFSADISFGAGGGAAPKTSKRTLLGVG